MLGHPGRPVAGEPDAEGRQILVLPFDSLDAARRRLLAFGPDAEVLAPASLRHDLLAAPWGVVARYGPPPRGHAGERVRTVVITGGTDGIGRALADTLLRRGDRVVAIARDPRKGRAWLERAAATGAGDRARFVAADLSLVTEANRAGTAVMAEAGAVDALVLCARRYRSARTETAEGVEENFALFYLSRYLLGHGLAPALARAPDPVVVNVAGPGAPLDVVRWRDLELRRDYHGGAALGQGGKLNDLLGVAFAQRYAGIAYVLVHPGVTATGFCGTYDAETLAHVETMRRTAKPAAAAVPPILAAIDAPPAEPLTALVEGRRIAVDGPDFDPGAAARLWALTKDRLGSLAPHEGRPR
ncbi:SDR family NAD(P)-dependent oxidoreductase [Dactylosporangium sp. CA-233914]|uniref:SDR family NAD(P)-dependent oxidoreductase n=1 Tax=Dactylosporangium sp. CA-233914 TaxID=3239934 RepID=UPI003D92A613